MPQKKYKPGLAYTCPDCGQTMSVVAWGGGPINAPCVATKFISAKCKSADAKLTVEDGKIVPMRGQE
jgi:hypothetical protein